MGREGGVEDSVPCTRYNDDKERSHVCIVELLVEFNCHCISLLRARSLLI